MQNFTISNLFSPSFSVHILKGQTAKSSDYFRQSAVLAADMTRLNEVDCRISISGSQLVSGGNTREGWRRPAGEGRGTGLVVMVGGFCSHDD